MHLCSPEERETLQTVIRDVVSKGFYASDHYLSRLTSLWVSMVLALSPVVRLWTRDLYHASLIMEYGILAFRCGTARGEILGVFTQFRLGTFQIGDLE